MRADRLVSVGALMIWDAKPWIEAVRRDLAQVQRLAQEARASARARYEYDNTEIDVAVERFVFLTAYTVRKLREAGKLPDALARSRYIVYRYARIAGSTPLTPSNWSQLDHFYDLRNGHLEVMPLRDVCNRLIHSYVFMAGPVEDDCPTSGFFFNSDRTRARSVWRMDWSDFTQLLSRLLGEDITRVS
jgi:hypothetical protein